MNILAVKISIIFLFTLCSFVCLISESYDVMKKKKSKQKKSIYTYTITTNHREEIVLYIVIKNTEK